MTIKTLNKASKRARTENTDQPMRLHAHVRRAHRAVTTIEGLLLMFALLAILAIYIAHNSTDAASCHQFVSQLTVVYNDLRALPGDIQNLYNIASNAGNQLNQLGQ